jgi:hypothetical protein
MERGPDLNFQLNLTGIVYISVAAVTDHLFLHRYCSLALGLHLPTSLLVWINSRVFCKLVCWLFVAIYRYQGWFGVCRMMTPPLKHCVKPVLMILCSGQRKGAVWRLKCSPVRHRLLVWYASIVVECVCGVAVCVCLPCRAGDEIHRRRLSWDQFYTSCPILLTCVLLSPFLSPAKPHYTPHVWIRNFLTTQLLIWGSFRLSSSAFVFVSTVACRREILHPSKTKVCFQVRTVLVWGY